MTILLDTHFVLWVFSGAVQAKGFGWLDRYRPWGISPIVLLELQYLAEIGRVDIVNPEFTETLLQDRRFTVDDPPMLAVTRHALTMGWTRDPFDRLLAAHSAARRTPLCTVDRTIRRHHRWLVPELNAR